MDPEKEPAKIHVDHVVLFDLAPEKIFWESLRTHETRYLMCRLARDGFFNAVTEVGSGDLFCELLKFRRSQGQGDASEVNMEMSVLAFLDGKLGVCSSGCFFYLHVLGRFHR